MVETKILGIICKNFPKDTHRTHPITLYSVLVRLGTRHLRSRRRALVQNERYRMPPSLDFHGAYRQTVATDRGTANQGLLLTIKMLRRQLLAVKSDRCCQLYCPPDFYSLIYFRRNIPSEMLAARWPIPEIRNSMNLIRATFTKPSVESKGRRWSSEYALRRMSLLSQKMNCWVKSGF